MTDEQRLQASTEVVSRVVDGEAVLLDLASGKYFGLNEVGARAWEHLQTEVTLAALLERLQAEFEVERAVLRADLVVLLNELRGNKLVDVREP